VRLHDLASETIVISASRALGNAAANDEKIHA
jgi:hypothetical protein